MTIRLNLFIVFLAVFVHGGDFCTTIDGETGICKHLSECPAVIVKIDLRTFFKKYSKKKSCRRKQICCRTCTTPEGRRGIYKDISSCPHLTYNNRRFGFDIESYRAANTDLYCCAEPNENERIQSPPELGSSSCGTIHNTHDQLAIRQYPWSVDLEYKFDKRGSWVCKGTIISNQHVLTVAHCLTYNMPKYVKFGNSEKRCKYLPNRSTYRAFCVGIMKVIKHPKYISMAKGHDDIGIIVLKYPVRYSEYVQPICLPSTRKENKELLVVSGRNYNKKLLRMREIEKEICWRLLKPYLPKTNSIVESQICAIEENGLDACKGDSGSGLMMESSGRFELVGIVSMGLGDCGVIGVPGIYTRIFSYIDWIITQTRTQDNLIQDTPLTGPFIGNEKKSGTKKIGTIKFSST